MEGWVKIHRKINNWEWKTKPLTYCLFVHLLTMAAHKPTKWRGMEINAGEILTGRTLLSKQTGLSERQVRTALEHLKSTNEVTIKSTNEYSIISIVKWNMYQTSDQPTADERPASDQRPTTYKKVKKVNNDKEGKKEGGLAPLVLPHWLPILEWEGYCQHRGRNFTTNAKSLAIQKLDGWRQQGYDPAAILNESTMNGWKGLFEPKEGKKQNARQKLGNDAQALLERIGSGEYS